MTAPRLLIPAILALLATAYAAAAFASPSLLRTTAGPTATTVSALAGPPHGYTTVVFDAGFEQTVVDKRPAGPSVGDVEHDNGRLRDAAGRPIGTLHVRCVLTRLLPNGDALERCTGKAATADGRVRVSGIGHLNPPNPPWDVTGLSGRYVGLHGRMTYSMDIPLGESSSGQIPAGQFDSVDLVEFRAAAHLRVGVVPRPAANTKFISRADSLCEAIQANANNLPPFPFSNFDPFHPDPSVLPQVGRFFNQPDRRRLGPDLLNKLTGLGAPRSHPAEWTRVLRARKAQIINQTAQVKAALADHAAAFVRTVKHSGPLFNELVLTSAVFGVQACTFG